MFGDVGELPEVIGGQQAKPPSAKDTGVWRRSLSALENFVFFGKNKLTLGIF